MSRNLLMAVLSVLFFITGGVALASEKAPQELVDLAEKELVKLGSDPIIVRAVQIENSKEKTLSQVKEIEAKWEDVKPTDDIAKLLLESECANYLKKLVETNLALEEAQEIYVLDNLGALVASNKLEEKYWWGDYKGFPIALKGDLYVSDFEFDQDENEYMIHIMVPVKDGEKIIGVVDIGMEIED